MNGHSESENKNESRALVALEPQCCKPRIAATLAAAPFVVQLTANAKGFAAYRAKRRADPETCAGSYRAANTRAAGTRESRTLAWL